MSGRTGRGVWGGKERVIERGGQELRRPATPQFDVRCLRNLCLCRYQRVYVCMCMCMCVSVCARARACGVSRYSEERTSGSTVIRSIELLKQPALSTSWCENRK